MIRVIVADDFAAMRQAMQRLLAPAPDIDVVAEAGTYEAAVRACQMADCDVIVLDDRLPPYACDQIVAQLRQAQVTAAILVTSMHADPGLARRALGSGANGFILKTELADHFVAAMRTVHAGKTYLSPHLAEELGPLS